ncbi:malate synthase [Paracoccus aminophilus]|uniref:malate synthase n=1 Tax=Paracoccus aminophilus JCM 7686 TaxID=1367847 RepID=S5Y7F3_PARAH|nr:aldolase/citrate lyase family protein [Paracoccus aminophilus]AGT11450.1 malate synthase [Paracoccus aminophilus JCM 7686]
MPLDRSAQTSLPIVLRAAPEAGRVLTPEALAFVGTLQARFGLRLHAMMIARARHQERIDRGELPDYLSETTSIRQGIWEAAPAPLALRDRRVEILCPVDRKSLAAGLGSGAKVMIADFEDTTSPGFANIVTGHANLIDLRDGALHPAEDSPAGTETPALIIRPRGLHLNEANILAGGQPISAALFDFGLSLYHCGRALAERGQGPFYYLPKLQGQDEARFWNDVFLFAQEEIGLAPGTIRATVIIETLQAAFETDEIVWQLKDHIAGLCCGARDFTFSYIKTLRNHAAYVLPDRDALHMESAFLAAYTARVVKVCHRRGIHAIGGMSAALPVANDTDANRHAFDLVRHDKEREVSMGFDGCWVAHPGLVAVAQEVFDRQMPRANQISRPRQEWRIEPAMLLRPHQGQITLRGVQANIAIAMEYLSNWLMGRGTVPIAHLLEDAATAETSRAQLWQWVHHRAPVEFSDGEERLLTADWLGELIQAEIVRILDRIGPNAFHRGHYAPAARLVHEAATARLLPEFITLAAYDLLNALD